MLREKFKQIYYYTQQLSTVRPSQHREIERQYIVNSSAKIIEIFEIIQKKNKFVSSVKWCPLFLKAFVLIFRLIWWNLIYFYVYRIFEVFKMKDKNIQEIAVNKSMQ